MIQFLIALLAAASEESLKEWKLERTIEIQVDLHHVQGIDVEENTLWVSSVNANAGKGFLSRLELQSGRLLGQVEVQQGKRIHPGGITLDGSRIWIPVAEYDRDGPTNMEARDKLSLKLISSFEVEDHIGCVAASDTELIGGSWGSRVLYRWTKLGKQLDRKQNPSPAQWQDLKMDGKLLVGSGDLNDARVDIKQGAKKQGAVEWFSLPDFTLQRRLLTHTTERNHTYSHEGMTLRGGKLYFLPEDAPSKLYIFTR